MITLDHIEKDNFIRATRQLQNLTGMDLKKTIRFQGAVVLEKILRETGKAEREKIRRRYTLKATAKQVKDFEVPKQDPLLTQYITVGGNRVKVRKYIFRGSVELALVKEKLKQLRELAVKRIGLSKATSLFWAKGIGVNIKAPKYVNKAFANSGRYEKSVSVRSKGEGDKFTFICETTSASFIFGAKGRAAVHKGLSNPNWGKGSVDIILRKIETALAGTGVNVT